MTSKERRTLGQREKHWEWWWYKMMSVWVNTVEWWNEAKESCKTSSVNTILYKQWQKPMADRQGQGRQRKVCYFRSRYQDSNNSISKFCVLPFENSWSTVLIMDLLQGCCILISMFPNTSSKSFCILFCIIRKRNFEEFMKVKSDLPCFFEVETYGQCTMSISSQHVCRRDHARSLEGIMCKQ